VVDDLEERHRLSIPQEAVVKKEVAVDILLIFTEKTTVKFVKSDKTVEEVRGRWCCVCR
jgi:hypothetical protein